MKIVVSPAYRPLTPLLQTLPERFEQEGETLHAGRNTVKRFLLEGGEWIVKRYKRPHLIQQIAYTFFRASKAERAFRFASRLQQLGFSTPGGIAFIEMKKRGLLTDSYFVSTACHDPAVTQELPKTGAFQTRLADELAAFLVSLHEKGVLHGDLNLNNILYRREAEGQCHFTLIDTNRTRFVETPSAEECLENLKRITHRRDLLQYITEQYAHRRGWNASRCATRVLAELDKFEQRNRWKKKLKGKKP